jgi:hypothetical protein
VCANVDAVDGAADLNGTMSQQFISYPSSILSFGQQRPVASGKCGAPSRIICDKKDINVTNSREA